nr:reverse transcriptase domain-containing protein [Tanacetum cinerariifolium]
MPPEDDVLPAEEQPLPGVVSPIANSLGYITETDPEEDPEEEDPEEEDDEDPKEDPADYPTDKDDEEEEEESFRYDANKKEEAKGEDKEEEHLALADSVPPPAYRATARVSIRAQIPITFPSETEVDRLHAIPNPPPSLLASYSLPLPRIPSPPLPTSPTYAEAPLGYRAAMIWLRSESPSTFHPLLLPPPIILPRTRVSMVMMRAAAPFTYCLKPPSRTSPLLPIPLPTSSPPLLIPSTDCKADVLETVGQDAAHGIPWNTLMKMMTTKYCPRNEIKKLEIDIWEVEESDKIEKYVDGLLNMIHWSVLACKPKTIQDAVEFGRNETLIVHGDRSDRGNKTHLNIISCTKMQKYMLKGCHVFLAHVTTKKTEDKSEGKRLEDVLIIQDFLEVFPEDLLGLSLTR